MKTKEEILEDQFYTSDSEDRERIFQAMDEYAQHTAMEFAKFTSGIDTDHYFWCDIEKVWRTTENDKVIKFTDSELFAKFEAERNQHQSELTCPICQSNRILEWPDKYQCRKCEHVWEREAK